ncbi:MAG TPA: hypothetical protein PK449_07660, partial [Exilispira sp.]|nr:hypothetical protein [Exilispira sp.]
MGINFKDSVFSTVQIKSTDKNVNSLLKNDERMLNIATLIKKTQNLELNNLRYVALTRARDFLNIFCKKDTEKDNKSVKKEENKKSNKNCEEKELKSILMDDETIARIKEIFGNDIYDEFNSSQFLKNEVTNIKNLDKNEKQNRIDSLKIKALEEDILTIGKRIGNRNKLLSYTSIGNNAKKKIINTKPIEGVSGEEQVLELIENQKINKGYDEREQSFSGAFAGIVIHSILEDLNKHQKDIWKNSENNLEKLEQLCKNNISMHFENSDKINQYAKDSTMLIYNTLNAILPGINTRISDIVLSQGEVEFIIPSKSNDYVRLSRILCDENLVLSSDSFENESCFANESCKDISIKEMPGNDMENKFKGFFQGFIDLLFIQNKKIYIIDWKTNRLDLGGEQNQNYADLLNEL